MKIVIIPLGRLHIFLFITVNLFIVIISCLVIALLFIIVKR
jgi:hypothetical protein